MPILNLKVAAEPSPALAARLAAGLVDITSAVLGKRPDITAVAVDFVRPEHWIVGGRSLADHGASSFWLDIKVVEGTNTKDEKGEVPAPRVRLHGRGAGPAAARRELRPGPRGQGRRLRLWQRDPGASLHRQPARAGSPRTAQPRSLIPPSQSTTASVVKRLARIATAITATSSGRPGRPTGAAAAQAAAVARAMPELPTSTGTP